MRSFLFAVSTYLIFLLFALILSGVATVNGVLAIINRTPVSVDLSSVPGLIGSTQSSFSNLAQAENLIAIANLLALSFLVARVLIPEVLVTVKQLGVGVKDFLIPERSSKVATVTEYWRHRLIVTLSRNLHAQANGKTTDAELLFIGEDLELLPENLATVAKLDVKSTSFVKSLFSIMIWTILGVFVTSAILIFSSLNVTAIMEQALTAVVCIALLVGGGALLLSISSTSNLLFSRRLVSLADVDLSQTQLSSQHRMEVLASPTNIPLHIQAALKRSGNLGLHLFDARVSGERRSDTVSNTGDFRIAPTLESNIQPCEHKIQILGKKRLAWGWALLVIGGSISIFAAMLPLLVGISGVSWFSYFSPLTSITIILTAAMVAKYLIDFGREFVSDGRLLVEGEFSTSEFTFADIFGGVISLNKTVLQGDSKLEAGEQGCRLNYDVHSVEVTFFSTKPGGEKQILSAKASPRSEEAAQRMVSAIESLTNLDGVTEFSNVDQKRIQKDKVALNRIEPDDPDFE